MSFNEEFRKKTHKFATRSNIDIYLLWCSVYIILGFVSINTRDNYIKNRDNTRC